MDNKNPSEPESSDLDTTLELLESHEATTAAPTAVYYGLSGLTSTDLERVKPVWEKLLSAQRLRIMQDLAEASETNFDFDYRTLGLFGLNDSDAHVRRAAIDVLWEDETLEFMNRMIDSAQWDEVIDVRVGAVKALGRFLLLGELGKLPETEVERAQDVVINLYSDSGEDMDVRRRALEALANCSHEIVADAIRESYTSYDQRMRVSAVYAMGRSCNAEWEDSILRELTGDDPEIRYEAARAAGELALEEAIPYLRHLVNETDREIKEAAIWSLGEIGGNEASHILTALADEVEETDDDDLVEAIEDAIGNASLTADILPFFSPGSDSDL